LTLDSATGALGVAQQRIAGIVIETALQWRISFTVYDFPTEKGKQKLGRFGPAHEAPVENRRAA
jgi:hypothetical protein